ncbi:MAG: hypothetical protein HC851_24165 [Acaryochloris sp. RU_4_1]|nr:hypothetical protein [Acaryochloris sp. RU_4_1]NJR57224.1 hypothetical protein [Acaryochloris sp. CRU_2_0]
MPSPQWFEDNPKVSAYIPKELHNALETWMREKQIKKVSQALTKILEIHLGFAEESPAIAPGIYATVEQLDKLRGEMQAIVERVESLPREQPGASKPLVDQLNLIDEQGESNEWMTTKEAHNLYGKDSPYEGFRKYSAEKLREEFELEADISRKEKGKSLSRWIRKIEVD